ncbi:retrovirus-related pol polyprotein from transposon TNT 1-94 [Tanacetum coccineum]|uniref:Retrovirus-related pol polyprotein from transposon TNT 1-94 n=1 Tax=Tanacetum coccineum TaxID=301880 RepID=A0ABQ4ZLM2_9ASTR
MKQNEQNRAREWKEYEKSKPKEYLYLMGQPDYALWEVIENGNSWVPIPVTTPPETGTSTTIKMTVPATTEEKTCKKNDVKARSLLLMVLPNEHQLTFDQYVDAQSMFAAIKARFGGNEATKKTRKALLKQQYENFSALSSESLDSIFTRLQKLVSRLAILGVVTPPEDLNKVKKSAGASNDDKNLAFVTTSGASSTNNINTVNPEGLKLFHEDLEDMNTELVKGSKTRTEESSKREEDELESDMSKKQKIDEHVEVEKDDQEEAEIKRHIEIVKDDEVAIDASPLATKPPVIVEYQIDKDGRMVLIEKTWRPSGSWLKLNMRIQGQRMIMKECYRGSTRNKARLVAQGYNQQEGIDYDKTYAPVARLESIRILLAIAYANDFKLYQMDVKSAFLNGCINEEVYVSQPLGFIDFQKPNYVYKLKKALYGLKQAPKAWYDRLKAFLIKHEYSMGMVDNTLFTKKSKSHLIIVQIYVDDIIFGSTSQNLCDDFAKIMHDEFEMSMMGELNFFLGLQIKQMEDGIFFNQSKYIKEMLKKFGLEDSKPTKTPMSTEIKLTKDDEADSVDSSKYQENPKTTHLEAVKRIFRYIRGTSHLGLWYPKGTGIETIVYADSDHAGDYVDRKSTSGIFTFMGCCLTSWFAKKQTTLAISMTEAEYVSADKACQQALWMKQALIDYGIRLDDVPIMCDNKGAIDLNMQKKQLKTHSSTYPVPSLNNKFFSNMKRLTKGYTGVEIGLFTTMLTSPTPSSSPLRITSSPSLSSTPSTEPTFEPQPSPDVEYHVSTPNESPLHVVHSHGSDEGSLKLIELMNLVTKLSERIVVLEDDLKKTKQTYSAAFTKLILRIKKLESKVKTGKARKRARVVLSEDEEDDSSKQGRIDEDPNTYFHQDDEVDDDVVHDTTEETQPEDSTAGIEISTAPINDNTASESLSTAGKETRKYKGKAIMTEPEPEKKSKKLLEQERLGLEEAIRL